MIKSHVIFCNRSHGNCSVEIIVHKKYAILLLRLFVRVFCFIYYYIRSRVCVIDLMQFYIRNVLRPFNIIYKIYLRRRSFLFKGRGKKKRKVLRRTKTNYYRLTSFRSRLRYFARVFLYEYEV